MSTATYLQNGQVTTSTAMTPVQMQALFQTQMCQMLGLIAELPLLCSIQANNPILTTPLIATNLAIGFLVESPDVPVGTTIISLDTAGQNFVIGLSNNATATAVETVLFSDPVTNYRVRINWPIEGAPAWSIGEDVMFLACVEIDNDYNKVRNQISFVPTSNTRLTKTIAYTRVWRISLTAYGPNAVDSIRQIKSLLLEDFSSGTLALNNLYTVSAFTATVRNPELFEGQWWERADFSFQVYENVTETITIPIAASVEVIGFIKTGQVFDDTFKLQE